MVVHILAGMLLGIQSYWDIKKQEIPLEISIIGGLIGILLSVQAKRNCIDIIMSLIPGVSLLVIGWLSKERVGYGDGIIICVLGLFYTWNKVWRICYISLMLSAGVALLLFIIGKKRGNDTIPFVPFLTMGWFVNICL